MSIDEKERVREYVREKYGEAARGESDGCGCGCGTPEDLAKDLGYDESALDALPEGADLLLGCGVPGARAAYRPGETILDLGAGGGADCFLAAKEVGPEGRVIGVDMTADMISRARRSAAEAGVENVEFRLGEIENLPVADGTVDVIISNCVVNLSPEKDRVYREAFRVLRPGGRLAISDVVALGPLPAEVRETLESIAACIGGAQDRDGIEGLLTELGFRDVRVDVQPQSEEMIARWLPGRGLEGRVASAMITAIRPE